MDVAPMHSFCAHAAGSGKSYIVEIASTIATGDTCALASMAQKEEALEKRLSSLIIGAHRSSVSTMQIATLMTAFCFAKC